jgi:hypothetical protein
MCVTHRPTAESQGAYDWHADYVKIAVQSGNMPVLKVLLAEGWVLKWQQAEVRVCVCWD